MSSIVGVQGLEPTYNIIKFTKNIAIANKGDNYLWMEYNKQRT